MNQSDCFYHKLKLLLIEYDDVLQLDKNYMKIFLDECISSLNLSNNDFESNKEVIFNNKGEKQLESRSHSFYCIQLYRKLAKILHPDKNENKYDDFIKMSTAFEKDDFITLFILSYENNIKVYLSQEEIELLNNHIDKKQNELLEIKNKIHWKWVLAENDLEKHCIKEYIINNQ